MYYLLFVGSIMRIKYLCASILLIIVSIIYSRNLPAGGIKEDNNQSAEFIKSVSRSTSTDIGAFYYNPVGTTLMNDGSCFYIQIKLESVLGISPAP